MTQHAAFVMNIAVRFGDPQRRVVMCRACGYKRPRMIADCGEAYSEAFLLAGQHNASTIVTDALGKAI
jgi:hypothetical protein